MRGVRASRGFMLPWKPPRGMWVSTQRHPDTHEVGAWGLFITWRGALCKTPGMISFLSLPLHRWHHDKVSLALQGSTQMPLLLEGIQAWVKIFILRKKKPIDCQFCICYLCHLRRGVTLVRLVSRCLPVVRGLRQTA